MGQNDLRGALIRKGYVASLLSGNALAVHDIEIGAGATAAKLVELGWLVYFCVLTTEAESELAMRRQEEARLDVVEQAVPMVEVVFGARVQMTVDLVSRDPHQDRRPPATGRELRRRGL